MCDRRQRCRRGFRHTSGLVLGLRSDLGGPRSPLIGCLFSQNLPTSSWCGGHTKVLGQESSAGKVGLAAGSGDPWWHPHTI